MANLGTGGKYPQHQNPPMPADILTDMKEHHDSPNDPSANPRKIPHTPCIKLPPELTGVVVKAMAHELAALMVPHLEDVQLLTINQVAERLQVSSVTARKLVKECEHVDLGEASQRISVRQLRALIESRTVPASAKR